MILNYLALSKGTKGKHGTEVVTIMSQAKNSDQWTPFHQYSFPIQLPRGLRVRTVSTTISIAEKTY